MTARRATAAAMTLRGWHLASIGSSKARRKPTSPSRGREPLRERRAGLATANKGSLLRAVLAPTLLQRLRRVGPSPALNLLLLPRRATRLNLWRRGRRLVAMPRPRVRGKKVEGVLALALAQQGARSLGLRLPVRGSRSRRGAARGQLVEALAGGSLFPWGKASMS